MKLSEVDIPAMKMFNRRDFLRTTSAAALALTSPLPSNFFKDNRMGIVVHSYGIRWNSKIESQKYPGFKDAVELLEHCHSIGASGIQVGVKDWTKDFAGKVREKREKLGMYVEGSIGVPFKPEDVPAFERDVVSAKEAGALILRTVCTSGRRYEIYHSREDFDKAHKAALTALQLAEPVLKKHKVKLAIENHKDWRATELADMIKQLKSEWIGVTLDFGNSLALMEDPMEVVKTLAPYMFTTHVKDMGLDEYPDGMLLSEVPLGTGILDLQKIVGICKQNYPSTTFNLEMITRDPLQIPFLTDDYWQTFRDIPGNDLARTIRLARTHKTKEGLPRVSQLTPEERLAAEENNILACLSYSSNTLGLK